MLYTLVAYILVNKDEHDINDVCMLLWIKRSVSMWRDLNNRHCSNTANKLNKQLLGYIMFCMITLTT